MNVLQPCVNNFFALYIVRVFHFNLKISSIVERSLNLRKGSYTMNGNGLSLDMVLDQFVE